MLDKFSARGCLKGQIKNEHRWILKNCQGEEMLEWRRKSKHESQQTP